jgi:hypothetical protein
MPVPLVVVMQLYVVPTVKPTALKSLQHVPLPLIFNTPAMPIASPYVKHSPRPALELLWTPLVTPFNAAFTTPSLLALTPPL